MQVKPFPLNFNGPLPASNFEFLEPYISAVVLDLVGLFVVFASLGICQSVGSF